ncbi:hypothetical protein BQ8482_180373 [Mesorhizobium delmotii]|uniref:Uncharacterized protein n=1 Tax=Mesorhizobium delmotii TaxID=1631247 RepID=A0A2P9AJ33_9HYPH|nr:hypothetical protein BQ8482_180373 [Mesorhizobium delmotii]
MNVLFEEVSGMSASGATATSRAVAGNVRFKAVAELASMADMGRKADGFHDWPVRS